MLAVNLQTSDVYDICVGLHHQQTETVIWWASPSYQRSERQYP